MEKQMKIWRSIAIAALCLLLIVSMLFGFWAGWKQTAAPAAAETPAPASAPTAAPTEAPTPVDPLSLWSGNAEAKQALTSFVEAATAEGGEGYIPVDHRIAVFDMDGTLACETYYTYYDTMMFIEYCLVDHPERVSDELKQIAAAIKPGYVADETLARNFARAFAGMTVEEFYDYAVEFGKKKTDSFNDMRYIDNFYLPMVELVRYLYENGFTIYVISGTERTTTRAIVANSPIRDYVTPNHVIGTAFEVKQAGHETESSNMNFKYENGDELVITGGFIQKNLNGNKSIWIEREIGQRPVLAFGNSGSDTSMMNYTIDSRNPYPAQAYMVVADDGVREWGAQDWEAKSADYRAKGYIPISMKNDFTQIYAEGITRADQQYRERDWSDAPWYEGAAPSDETQTQTSDVILSDDPSDFVLLSEAVPDAILEIRYYSTYNFVGDRIDGYEEPLAMLTTEAAAALREVSDELMGMGYRLKIFDAYRPQMAVTHFMNWALDTDDTRMKAYFYPDLEKDVLFPQGYIAEYSGHSRGSTVDLTLFDMNTEREVDMGGTFDFFGELSHPDYTDITEEQYAMRMLLREVMMKHGFRPLPEEWWHFTLENEPYPDTYFTFPINSDVIGRSGSAPLTDEMKFDDGVDLSAEDGADSVERNGDHADSPYFSHLDFYDLESTDSLTILSHFKTIQQSSEWSCGVASALMMLEWYGRRGEYTEESLAALRPQGLEPGPSSLSEIVAMFDGVGGFTCYSAIDAGEDVHDVFTFDFIRDTLAAGDPILIGWNDWGGHWQVIIGYDTMGTETTQDDVIIVADPYDTTDHDQDGYGVYGAERFLYNFTFYDYFEGDELNDMCFLTAKPA